MEKYALKATPHKDRLTALHAPYLHLFRHLTQISLDWQPPNCTQFAQSGGGFRLTKNLTSQSARNLCAVLP